MPRDNKSSVHTRTTHKLPIRRRPKKKKLPINLRRQAQREARYRNAGLQTNKKKRKTKKRKPDFERSEHEALVQATEMELQRILGDTELLTDIPYDCTPEELLGEIALAKGHATTIYIKRDGISTLTVVLPQSAPTIANLKRAIESTARVQLKRELRERHEERLRRRNESNAISAEHNSSELRNIDEHCAEQPQQQLETQTAVVVTASSTTLKPNECIRNTGELVYSTTRSGHHHRPNVSWRFLWRAYALFNVDTNLPLNDTNGRVLLSACGIENASTLKFCNREKYFGRKRQ